MSKNECQLKLASAAQVPVLKQTKCCKYGECDYGRNSYSAKEECQLPSLTVLFYRSTLTVLYIFLCHLSHDTTVLFAVDISVYFHYCYLITHEVEELTLTVLHSFFVDLLSCVFPLLHPIRDLWEVSVGIFTVHLLLI